MTLRELCQIADGHGREAWNHTAALLAMLQNVNMDLERHPPVMPSRFHPYIEEQPVAAPKATPEEWAALKADFTKG